LAKVDRRKQRTEKLLRSAFIDLILEKGYDAVTVQDITERANLGRATFYLHYPDGKEQFFLHILREMFDDLKARSMPPSGVLQAADLQTRLIPFQHALEYRDLYRATLLSQQGMGAVMNGVREYLVASLQERLEQIVPEQALSFPLEVLANYLAGAMISLMSWWLKQDVPYTAEQMAEMFYKLSLPTILTLVGEDENQPDMN
jgi:AcrR family transcriptional regulator